MAQSAPQSTPQPLQPAQKPVTQPAKQTQASSAPKVSNKKIALGCLSAFGCSIVLFVGILFAFLAFGSAENPIFKFLGVPAGEVVNALITFVNLIFLILTFAAFVLTVIGVFKITTVKKGDIKTKKQAAMFTVASFGAMVLLIFIWVFAYFFLSAHRQPILSAPITTVPEKTVNLTAPVTIKFDASNASINTRQFEILSYTWDFGDGTILHGKNQTHTFEDLGNFEVKLIIKLKEKATGEDTEIEYLRDVTIQNVLANVVIETDKVSGPAPLTVNLDGSKSSSPNGEIIAYAWDLDEDGSFDDGEENKAKTTFKKIGKYIVKLRVEDSTGEFSAGELEIEATASDDPVPVITVEGVEINDLEINKAYVFSAAASTVPSGTIEKYSWNFGDGAAASTRTATHTYENIGEYDVVLKITDSRGRSAEITERFSVHARQEAPIAAIRTTPQAVNGIINGQAPFSVIFDASSSQDINDNIVDFAWDFDADGKTDDTSAVTSHIYMNAGTYNASLTVTDSTEFSNTAQVVIQVEPAGLKAEISADPVSGTVPLTVHFDASASSYPDGNIVSFEWDFGDNTPPRIDTSSVTYQYTSIGTFIAKVTAIAADSKRDIAEIPINVRAVPVRACFAASAESGTAPLEVEFDPSCSTGTVINYRWNFANLSRSTLRKPTFTFEDPGEYEVSLEVADSQNVVDTFSTVITVEAE